jgi:WD40 repeat protein
MQFNEDVLQKFRTGRVFKVRCWIKLYAPYICCFLISFYRVAQPSEGNDSARINSIAFHRTQDVLVTASDDDAIRVYDTCRGVEQRVLFSKKYGVANICFSHDPNSVLYSSTKVRIWM